MLATAKKNESETNYKRNLYVIKVLKTSDLNEKKISPTDCKKLRVVCKKLWDFYWALFPILSVPSTTSSYLEQVLKRCEYVLWKFIPYKRSVKSFRLDKYHKVWLVQSHLHEIHFSLWGLEFTLRIL